MTPFDLVEPASLGEAIALLDPDDTGVRPIAGGTALMLMMKAGVFRPTRLVSLRKLPRLNARIAAAPEKPNEIVFLRVAHNRAVFASSIL